MVCYGIFCTGKFLFTSLLVGVIAFKYRVGLSLFLSSFFKISNLGNKLDPVSVEP